MRLLLLTTHYWEKGGIEVYVKTVERAARESGHDVEVLTITSGWIRTDAMPPAHPPGARLRWTQKLRFVLRFVWAASGRKYDGILCGHPYLAPFAHWWRRIGGPPYIVFAYGIEVWNGLAESRRRAVAAAGRVVTISGHTARRLTAACGVDAERIRMLYPCVPAPYLRPLATATERNAARARWGLAGRKAILTVGRQSRAESYKGADRLIHALPALRGAGSDVVCLIAGGGDGLDALRELAAATGVAELVQVLGVVSADDLMSLYDACDVFVLPSTGEGFGIVLVEAAARGRPSVGLQVGGIEDAMAGGRTGLLVREGDPAGLIAALQRVLSGDVPDGLRDEAELRKVAIAQFGYDRFRGQLDAILAEISGPPPGASAKPVAVAA